MEKIQEMKKDKEFIHRMGEYMVHIIDMDFGLCFEVYPIIEYTDSSGKKGVVYIDKENEPDEMEVFQIGKCLKKMQGSFCWRGGWECRLYFTDQEYWGEEIGTLANLYNDSIVRWCKEYIKKTYPNNIYDD